MTRRLTLSGGRSEMGLLQDPPEPETPPPSWSPAAPEFWAKQEFWRKPSKWQICMPRLRFIAKVLGSLILLVTLITYLGRHAPPPPGALSEQQRLAEIKSTQQAPVESTPPLPPPSPSPIPEPKRPITEEEINHKMEEDAKKEDWLWKYFPTHDGLTRGTYHLKECVSGDMDCKIELPAMEAYDGLLNFQEPKKRIVSCMGPRGLFLNESADDTIYAYRGVATGAVDPIIGSYEVANLDGSVSFDRIGRFGAYGLSQFDSTTDEEFHNGTHVKWDEVAWGQLQDACVAANQQRFKPMIERPDNAVHYSNMHLQSKGGENEQPLGKDRVKRTAILIRVWTGAKWTADVVMNIRAMIAEASLASGGKYQVYILLHVKDEAIPIFVGENEPQDTLNRFVPPEFHSITEVWNHAQIRLLYSNLQEHAFVGRSPWMIIQWFARNHPEFDFFYQWEFDVRYTGHYLDLFEGIDSFAKQQPRKGIWERAGRLYIPGVHGNFDTEFRKSTREEDPHHVWGPVSVEGVRPRGPKPPRSDGEDNYDWGVGEDADWIGLLPSFNVTHTNWWFRNYLWGYAQGKSTPRRATLIAQGRVSRRVLDIMSYENSENGHHMDAEMFPQTMCLHHGLKATSYPHPIFADREWPMEDLQRTFNGGPFGQAGGFYNSTFSKWNEQAWTNMTWYYSSGQAMPIYQRLMGITALESGGSEWEDVFGRTIVRPMLLHPVKGAKSWSWNGEDGWQQTLHGN